MTERVLPHDVTAERSVLGAVQIEPGMFDVATGSGLTAGMFFRDAHRRLWLAYTRLRAAGAVIDFVTLRSDLEAHGELEEVGLAYLAGLTDGVPKASNVEHYAAIVRDKARLRQLIAAANQTLAEAYNQHDLGEVLDGAERRLLAIGRDAAKGEFIPAPTWMAEVFRAIGDAANRPRDITGVPSGLAELDRLTRGWQPANLIVIGGRPGDGKSALMMQFANVASLHVGTAIVSLEMSREECGFRAVALEARVDTYRMATGRLADHEMERVGTAIERLSERYLEIDDEPGQAVASVCAKLRRLHARSPLGIVFIDYLQLLSGSGTEQNKTLEIEQISGRLLSLAKELRIPVVVLSQLTRDSAKAGAPPELHNLRNGGSIEQDAHVVLLIHRPNKRHETNRFQDHEEVELLLKKQRNGPGGKTIHTIWNATLMRFLDKQAAPEAGAPVQDRLP